MPLVLPNISALLLATRALTAAPASQPVALRQSTSPTVQVQREQIGNRFYLPECHVTIANGETPPGEQPSTGLHGSGLLWTQLWPEGTMVFRRGGARVRPIRWFTSNEVSMVARSPGSVDDRGTASRRTGTSAASWNSEWVQRPLSGNRPDLPHSGVLGSDGTRREGHPHVRRGRCEDRRGPGPERVASGRRPIEHDPGSAACP